MDEDYDKEWNIFTPTLAIRLRRLRCDQVFVQVLNDIIMSRSAIQVEYTLDLLFEFQPLDTKIKHILNIAILYCWNKTSVLIWLPGEKKMSGESFALCLQI